MPGAAFHGMKSIRQSEDMKSKTFALISLGCAKNLVNSEQMIYLMSEAGFELISDVSSADLVIINTCAFIDDAKQEAIDTILETAAVCPNIIVTGCLPERYKEEIASEFPEVKAFLGIGSFADVVPAAEAVLSGSSLLSFKDNSAPVEEIPRVISTGPSWAFLRIAEGCDNFCAFCAIPYIRGSYRSRSFENVLEEARSLAEHGVREIIIIAQDITRYGIDLYGRPRLAELCHEISKIDGVDWIRLHYLYPEVINDELIDEIASNDKIVKYLDIPIQHINDKILYDMNRHTTSQEVRSLFSTLRERIPGLVLRTSLITGLPGEGEAEFDELCCFLKEAKIERAGVFPYSPEEGTPAAEMPHVDYETAKHRADFIMSEIQLPIMDAFCASFIGKQLKVLCTGEENGYMIGRSYADSPDIDGLVAFEGDCVEGDFAQVLIYDAEDGVLYGKEIEK